MALIDFSKRRLVFLLAAIASLYLFYELLLLTGHGDYSKDASLLLSDKTQQPSLDEDDAWEGFDRPRPDTPLRRPDSHPITELMEEADDRWQDYEDGRSTSFRQVVEKYRNKYGRHPPPGFKEWYKFARNKNVWNIDDFEHIMDDLRPFWAVDPKILRTHTARMHENFEHGIAVLHIRNHKIVKVHNEMWRTDVMKSCINKFIKYLPDMDIPMNRLDQPRVVVPWEDRQELLETEYSTRAMPPETVDEFSVGQEHLWNENLKDGEIDESTHLDAAWFNAPGRQYMDIASKACPPESPARNPDMPVEISDRLYKEPQGGLVSNFNLSSDLCTVGPAIQNLHGMLFSASSIIASHKLVPIFGECKTSVNNDILFPANMYYKHDDRYDYSDVEDVTWKGKSDKVIWRGVTSGGLQIADNWSNMHRQRLVQLLNSTYLSLQQKDVGILNLINSGNFTEAYYEKRPFHPAQYAEEHTDVGFVKPMSCMPNCDFYNDVFTWLPEIPMSSHFKYKYLIDVDGHSFSGRWHAFLQSRSLGFKATIFREWHDSRLFAWRHFVPVDNRYDDLYSLLTYFTGYGLPSPSEDLVNPGIYVPMHDIEAQKIARQGREWANKVLRRDDIEVYMFRLLLEYGRIIDDNRDRIGYSGDGSELDKFDNGEDNWGSRFGFGKLWNGWGQKGKVPQNHDMDGQGDRLGFGKAPPFPSQPPAIGSDG